VDLVQYYRDFTLDEAPLQMLAYISKYGDDNTAVHEFRKKNSGELPEELTLRNKYKYDLYDRFDSIVFNETPVEIDITEDKQPEGKVIDIDWSKLDTEGFTLEGTSGEQVVQESDWSVVQEPTEAFEVVGGSEKVNYNSEETLLYNQDSRQRLVNDLEECEYFLRQRLAELQAKDSS